MALVKTTPYSTATTADQPALLSSSFTAAANVTLRQEYSASADQAGNATTWPAGALVSERHVSSPLKSAEGVEHPYLGAIFAIRYYTNSKKARVDVFRSEIRPWKP